jgi:hypothetical protein
VVWGKASFFRFVWSQGPFTSDGPHHVFPRRICTFKPILRVRNTTVINVYLADNAATMAWIIDWVFRLDTFSVHPLEQFLRSNLDLAAVTQ